MSGRMPLVAGAFARTFSPRCLRPTAVRGRTALRRNTMSRLPFLTRSLLLLFFFDCYDGVTRAEQNPGALALDSLVVTAARWPQPASELVADVTVIGAE